jgi:chaperonin cofactor prefoldin
MLFVRIFFFVGGISGCIGSLILTCASLLCNAPEPDFSVGWMMHSGPTWVFIATLIAGCMISLTQIGALLIYKFEKNFWYLSLYLLASALSCFITITTFHTGIQAGTINATHTSEGYTALVSDRDRVNREINALLDEKSQIEKRVNAMFIGYADSNYKTRTIQAADSATSEIATKERLIQKKDDQLRKIQSEINAYKGGDVVSTGKTYESIATDIKKLLGLKNSAFWNDRLMLIIAYWMLISTATVVDFGSTGMLAVAIWGMDFTVKNRSVKADKQSAETKTAAVDDGKRLPLSAIDVFTDLAGDMSKTKDSISGLVAGGKRSGKTFCCKQIAHALIKKGCKIYALDVKHVDPDDPWPAGTELVGTGYDYHAIGKFFNFISDEKDRRGTDMQNILKKQPVIIFFDEINLTLEEHPEFADRYVEIITGFAEYRIGCIVIGQRTDVDGLGLKGKGQVKKSFDAVIRCYRDRKPGGKRTQYVDYQDGLGEFELSPFTPVTFKQNSNYRDKKDGAIANVLKFADYAKRSIMSFKSPMGDDGDDGDFKSSESVVMGDLKNVTCDKSESPVIGSLSPQSPTTITANHPIFTGDYAKNAETKSPVSDAVMGDDGDAVIELKTAKNDVNYIFSDNNKSPITAPITASLSGDKAQLSEKEKALITAFITMGDDATPTGALRIAGLKKGGDVVKNARDLLIKFNLWDGVENCPVK